MEDLPPYALSQDDLLTYRKRFEQEYDELEWAIIELEFYYPQLTNIQDKNAVLHDIYEIKRRLDILARMIADIEFALQTFQGGNITKGWADLAPKPGKQRAELLNRCGSKAFLIPKEKKYPIIAKSGPCKVDCRGVQSAYNRARQYHHQDIANKAQNIKNKYC